MKSRSPRQQQLRLTVASDAVVRPKKRCRAASQFLSPKKTKPSSCLSRTVRTPGFSLRTSRTEAADAAAWLPVLESPEHLRLILLARGGPRAEARSSANSYSGAHALWYSDL